MVVPSGRAVGELLTLVAPGVDASGLTPVAAGRMVRADVGGAG
ncbi:hypothetical protein [Herbiconiux gentiana]|nr:hypothetical protein [Herbiconiux gentiana]